MALGLLKSLKSAYSNLNPENVRHLAGRSLNIQLVADSEESYSYMEAFLIPGKVSAADRAMGLHTLARATESTVDPKADLVIYEQGLSCPRGGFTFYLDRPERTVEEILEARPDIEVALARQFLGFRHPAVQRIVNRIARENALFVLMTAMPNIIPTIIELPWALGEYATDSAFLTVNQVRMAFLIAACSGRPIGVADQKAEILSIVGSAFGWRAVARELIGKIPLGGGLIPKAAIAWAGTFVVGRAVEGIYLTGDRIRRNEHHELYHRALGKGREVATQLWETIRKPSAA